ncbi:MAG: tetratricopeptide repeat protein [Bacteroidota bacterium]
MAQASLTDKLLAAKVPQLLGTFLAVGFGLLQFVEFVSTRYTFSSIWVDRYLLLWLGLLPAVALLIYYRGLPKKGIATGAGWKTALVFTNLAVVLGLLVFIDGKKGPETKQVAIVDADGQTEQRTIPTRSAVQRIAIFDFTNQQKQADENWWGTAYGSLLSYHLRQRPEVIVSSPMELAANYDRFGAEPFTPINVGTQRKIAQRARTDFFVSVEYNIEPSGHQVKGALHRTRDGKAVQTLKASAEDAYGVIDRLKEQIDDFLPPLGDLDQVESELPSSALMTDKEAALEPLVKGMMYFTTNPDDPVRMAAYFQEAVAADPSCANCALMLATSTIMQGKVDSAQGLARDALRLAQVLPEREQFLYKFFHFNINNQVDNVIKVLESFRALYPYDWMPYQFLETYYKMTYGLDSTAVLMWQAAELSNRELALERLYDIYTSADKYDKVEEVIEALEADFPDKNKDLMRRARLYRNTGRIAEAREVLEEMIALDPLNPEPANQLVNLELRLGEYARAEKMARQQLRQAATATDSISIWSSIIDIHGQQGKIDRALAELADYEVFLGKRMPRINMLQANFSQKARYALQTEDYATVEATLAELRQYAGEMADVFDCLLPFYHTLFDVPRAGLAEQFAACESTLASMGTMMAAYNEMTGLLVTEDYTAAADLINEKEAQGLKLGPPVAYARINRLAGRLDAARAFIDADLVSQPKNPELNLELARIAQANDDLAAAQEAVDITLAAYQAADPDFLPAKRAQALRDELTQ